MSIEHCLLKPSMTKLPPSSAKDPYLIPNGHFVHLLKFPFILSPRLSETSHYSTLDRISSRDVLIASGTSHSQADYHVQPQNATARRKILPATHQVLAQQPPTCPFVSGRASMPTFRQHDGGVSGAEWLGEEGSGKHDGHSSGILIPNALQWCNDFGNDPVDLVAAQRETFAVEMPKVDPVYGTEGPLMSLWMAEQAGASKSLSKGQPPSG
ncbi:predicted protein [Histoplasma capsulatum var. duboisii H88]|uniref:Predicted protein n=1 Tax=Ajellomyces capsulatus (strain H88) TaxID=544711 RepID=F0UU44_AJEC8|nr:predicted protein [Histoplasma capsulatum var. duboisii H88]